LASPVQSKKQPDASSRLDRDAWIRAGLDILADQGIDGVRIEPLAKRLGVTKGSFYWHFRDRADLLDGLLDSWRRRATLSIIERLDHAGESPAKRLRALLHLPFGGRSAEKGADLELVVRLWGRRDAKAHQILAEVDELRIRYLTQLLETAGVTEGESRARAILAYSYMRVANSLPSGADPLDAIVSLLVNP
jgi:AcrR family transcriptional regulator